MESTALWTALQRIGRRLLAVRLAAGAGWSLVGAIGIILLGVWLDLLWDLPPELRIGCLLVAGTTVLLLFGIAWRLAVQQYAPAALARRLDASAGTGGQILSGVDLLQLQNAPTDLTGGLAQLATVQAGQLAQKIPASAAVPARPVGWSFGSLVGLAVLVAVACLLMPRLAWTQWQRFTDPFADHSPFSRVVFNVQPGNVSVLYGQGLDINVTTEGATVERLDLILQTEVGSSAFRRTEPAEAGTTNGAVEVLPMFPEPNGTWRATLASVTAPGKYHVRSREGRSERFDITVITVPKIESVRFRVTPPAYTNRPPIEGPLPQGGLAGLPGTRVQVWAKSNRPLRGGLVFVSPPTRGKGESEELTPISDGSTEVTGEFEIRRGGQLTLAVTDLAGQASTEPFTAPVVLLADERPFVRIIEPREQSFATPTATIPVSIAAEDDYGIARLQLFRSLNDSRVMPLDLPVKQPARMRWSEMHLLPLSAYGLQPGDEIKLFARVEDTDPAGPKGAESSVVVIRIVAQEEFEKMLRQREGLEVLLSKYQQAQRRLEGLAEEMERIEKELEKLPPDSELAQEMRKELEKLAERMQKEAEEIRKSAQHKLPYDIDEKLSKHLEQLAKDLEAAAKEAKACAAKPSARAVLGDLKKLREKLAGQKKELQKNTQEPLEHLAKVFPLLEDAARFVELYQRQKDLAERLASLKGRDRPDDPAVKARMRDLQGEQTELREALLRLLDDIADHVDQLPEDPQLDKLRETATKFVKDVRASGADEAMTDAETALADFQGTKAFEAAHKAAEIMAKFISRCQGDNSLEGECMGCLKFQPKLSECLGDSIGQLLAELGLGSGSQPGAGLGNGSGYSARRSSMQNVGLYGQLPSMGEGMGSGSAQHQRPGATGLYRGSGSQKGQPNATDAASQRSATGTGDAAVPAPYRRKVAEYFQRIVEETGGK